jgi:hypothetical protein
MAEQPLASQPLPPGVQEFEPISYRSREEREQITNVRIAEICDQLVALCSDEKAARELINQLMTQVGLQQIDSILALTQVFSSKGEPSTASSMDSRISHSDNWRSRVAAFGRFVGLRLDLSVKQDQMDSDSKET